MRVASFVISLIALCTCWIPCVGWMAAIPAAIGLLLGIIGCIAAKKGEGKGLGIAGIILGAIAVFVGIANFHATDKAMKELKSESSSEQFESSFKKALEESRARFEKSMKESTESDEAQGLQGAAASMQKAQQEMESAFQQALGVPEEDLKKAQKEVESAFMKALQDASKE